MSKSTVSVIKVWEDPQRECFNVHINEVDILLSISKESQPETYKKVKKWIEQDGFNHYITPWKYLWAGLLHEFSYLWQVFYVIKLKLLDLFLKLLYSKINIIQWKVVNPRKVKY